MPLPPLPPENVEEPIPAPTSQQAKDAKPDIRIEHYVFSIKEFRRELKFYIEDKHIFPSGKKNVHSYARTICGLRTPIGPWSIRSAASMFANWTHSLFDLGVSIFRPGRYNTPFDIKFPKEQPDGHGEIRWIIVELDGKINWQFLPGTSGITSKERVSGENHSAFIVTNLDTYPNTALPYSEQPPVPEVFARHREERCRVMYWAVSAREPDIARGFNFYVEFYQEDETGTVRTMPTIFDPSVPNEGGPRIP